MKRIKPAGRVISILLTILMVISIIPFASAEETVPADVDELMALFDPGVAAPKQGSVLKEAETMIVDAGKGRSIDVMSKPGSGRKLYTAAEGAEVTVYARESGYVLGIVKETSAGGWMRAKFLAAANKEAGSLIETGLQYELGDGLKQDYIKAEECYKQAMELGSTEAMTRLAMLYLKDGYSDGRYGYTVFDPEEIQDPIELLFKAAEANDPTALLMLGDLTSSDNDGEYSFVGAYNTYCYIELENGMLISVCPNGITPGSIFDCYISYTSQKLEDFCSEHGMDTAREYYKRAYTLGSEEAAVRLDLMNYKVLKRNRAEEAERNEAREWLEERAEENDPYALFFLAKVCEGEESEKYYSLAESAALKQNNARVMVLLGYGKLPISTWDDDMDYDPDNDPGPKVAEFSAAKSLFRKAAESGDSGDIFWIIRALIYYDYDFFIMSEDGEKLEDKAVGKVAKEFIKSALSRCNAEDLGMLLFYEPFSSDIANMVSAECLLAAAEKGNIVAVKNLLEFSYERGLYDWKDSRFITRNFSKRLFNVTLEAAENGFYPRLWDDDSDYAIVWMYENGYGCRKNLKEAQKWAEIIGNTTNIPDEVPEDSCESDEEIDAPDGGADESEAGGEGSLLIPDVGDVVLFGSYEQDNDTSNGKEEIEWLVLARAENRILVISKYALDCQPYNNTYSEITWETCSLREWLNGTFLNMAFSNEERAMIPSVTVSADRNPNYDTSPGNSTTDQVFLLSISEAKKYFSSDDDRLCDETAFCHARRLENCNAQGIDKDEMEFWWSLRSPGFVSECAAGVNAIGYIFDIGYPVDFEYGLIRPALWIETGS